MIKSVEQFDTAISEPNDTPQHRQDFDKYVDFLDKRGLKGSPKLDVNNLGANLLNTYIKENPSTTLTPDSHIHAQNDMSNLNPNETSVVDGLHSTATKSKFSDKGDPSLTTSTFGNWAGSQDTKVIGKKLMDLGLQGADQVFFDNPNTSTRDGVINSKGDWFPSSIALILENAKRLGIRTPEQVDANKDVLIGNPRFREAINSQTFQNLHPNFWQVISNDILPKQWAAYDEQQKQNVAKK